MVPRSRAQLFDILSKTARHSEEYEKLMHMHATRLVSPHTVTTSAFQCLGAVSHLPLAAFITDITARNPRTPARNLRVEPGTSYRMRLLHTDMPDSVRWTGYAIVTPRHMPDSYAETASTNMSITGT